MLASGQVPLAEKLFDVAYRLNGQFRTAGAIIDVIVGERHPLRQYAASYRAADNFADLARGLEETLAELPDYDTAWDEQWEEQ